VILLLVHKMAFCSPCGGLRLNNASAFSQRPSCSTNAPRFSTYHGKSLLGSVSLNTSVRAPSSSSARNIRSLKCVISSSETSSKLAGTADIDWKSLLFAYIPTRCHVKYTYSTETNTWSGPELQTESTVNLHIGATALHYGQSCFEGLKAFHCKDGKVRLFRPDENSKRLNTSAHRLCMPQVPLELFLEATKMAVRENVMYVPPYGSGGSLYIRPLLFGSGPKIGLAPADEYTLLVMVTPVGDYYKGGLSPVTGYICDGYDRAAPRGVGNAKVGANYAADILPNQECKKKGFPINLYLDALERKYVEEFGTSNFVAIKNGTYVTPDSASVLKSITNKSLMELASLQGLKVEQRKISVDEIETFEEVAACGTAVVITPVSRFVRGDATIQIGDDPNAVGPTFASLYKKVRAIQTGDIEDQLGWTFDAFSS